jgi:hypothetical protein
MTKQVETKQKVKRDGKSIAMYISTESHKRLKAAAVQMDTTMEKLVSKLIVEKFGG